MCCGHYTLGVDAYYILYSVCIAVLVLQSSCPGQVWWIHDPPSHVIQKNRNGSVPLDKLGNSSEYLDGQEYGGSVLALSRNDIQNAAFRCSSNLFQMATLSHKWAKTLIEHFGDEKGAEFSDLCLEFSAQHTSRIEWFPRFVILHCNDCIECCSFLILLLIITSPIMCVVIMMLPYIIYRCGSSSYGLIRY